MAHIGGWDPKLMFSDSVVWWGHFIKGRAVIVMGMDSQIVHKVVEGSIQLHGATYQRRTSCCIWALYLGRRSLMFWWLLVNWATPDGQMPRLAGQGHILAYFLLLRGVPAAEKRLNLEKEIYTYKHNAELQRTDPGTKVTGEFSTRDIFSHLMFEMNLYHFHRFSWEKIH